MTGEGDPEKLPGVLVSANFFDTLGVTPAMGRPFLPEEEQPGRDHEVILSHGLWQRRFGSDPNVLGKTIRLDGAMYDIVGVMGKDYDFPLTEEIWRPLTLKPAEQTLRSERYLMPIARLKPGVSVWEAAAEIQTIQAQLRHQFPQTETGWSVKVMTVGATLNNET